MKNKVLIGIIIVLIGVIVAEGVYLFTNKEDRKENNSSINVPKEENAGDEINSDLLVDTYDVDGEKIRVEYKLIPITDEDYINELTSLGITDEMLNEVQVSIYWNEKLMYEDNRYIGVATLNDLTEQNLFLSNNFSIITGEDQEKYLAIIFADLDSISGVNKIYYQIYNSDGNKLTYDYHGVQDMFYIVNTIVGYYNDNNELINLYSNDLINSQYSEFSEAQIFSKIRDNKIYTYLTYYCGRLEEYEVTISNNQINLHLLNSLEDLIGAGGTACYEE
ncbi:MAG TPA: hypothetical protein IAB49_03435 [Candidatus Caccenecus avistercoris]|nr:hypothetical protein [Candidatus Caccenecus avistercoris]